MFQDGCVDPSEDYVNQIVDPVRLSVNALASSLISVSNKVPRSTSLHNSLPDLASPDHEELKVSFIFKFCVKTLFHLEMDFIFNLIHIKLSPQKFQTYFHFLKID